MAILLFLCIYMKHEDTVLNQPPIFDASLSAASTIGCPSEAAAVAQALEARVVEAESQWAAAQNAVAELERRAEEESNQVCVFDSFVFRCHVV